MGKTVSIFKYEFLHTIRRKGFIILTLALPVLALLSIGVYRVAASAAKPQSTIGVVGYVDESGRFGSSSHQGNTRFTSYASPDQAKLALQAATIQEYIVIPKDFISSGVVYRYTLRRGLAPPAVLTEALKGLITRNLIEGRVPPLEITRIEAPVHIVTTTLTAAGEVAKEQGGYSNFIVPALFSALLALSLMFTSAYLLQGLGEEKENRIIEILLSSVTTRQLLTGKVTGLGAAGLTQVLIWVATIPVLLTFASSTIGGILKTIHLPIGFWLLGVLYFLLGYALFAVLSACVAAVSRTVREAQSIAPLFTLFSVAPFWFISLLMFFPDSPVWVVFSIFPLSGPVLTLLRIGITGVPAWQLLSSIGVLLLCIIGGMLLAARLLELYLLSYGHRPKLSEILQRIRTE